MKFSPGILKLILVTIIIMPVLSCCRKNAPQTEREAVVRSTIVDLESPEPNKVIKCGDSVRIAYLKTRQDVVIDSIALFEGKKHVISRAGDPGEVYWHSGNSKMGQNTLRIQVYHSDSLFESHNINLIILSDIIPKNYAYRVIGKYPHDNKAYTQGLLFDGGYLYESTGLEGKSSVRMVDIKTGKPVKLVPLAPQYFGEGIALHNDQIYQITYKSQVGFVYDKNTLSQIRSFDYQIREGWGLTTDGNNLIMSDGTSQLFFIEPEYFTQVDQIRVFDNTGMIDSLNEIEFINGKILANVYGKSFIVVIDPATGKVLGKADFKDLVPEGYENDYGHVLNGIAWNPATGNLYITGKNWPVLYEIILNPPV
jgi:glutamine cyclotransferase